MKINHLAVILLLAALLTACNQIEIDNETTDIAPVRSSENTQIKLNVIDKDQPLQQFFVLIDQGCEFEPVSVDSIATNKEEAIELLLNFKQAQYGGTGFANTIYQSQLALESLEIENSKAILNLSGELKYQYEDCDPPQIKSQIENTLLQFEDIDEVEIFINQEKL